MAADPLTPAVSDRICKHMNDDHAEAVLAFAKHYGGAREACTARMLAVAPEAMRLEVDGGGATEFTVPATGGWQSYRMVDAGRVTVPAGAHRAILRALSKPGEAVVNVRAVRLVREPSSD